MKKLLILSSRIMSEEIISYAKSLGVYTIVADNYPPEKSPAKLIADEAWDISLEEMDELERMCREHNVTGSICGLSEYALEKCMELCERMGWPCYCNKEAWHYSRDKADFKAVCKRLGAPVATDFYLSDELTDEEINQVKFPVVVKPVDQMGNVGISFCYNKDELIRAYKYARSVSHNPKIVVERMLKGEEWYSSYAFSNGEVRLLALNSMIAQTGEPKNCYTITTTISNHVEQYIKEINPHIERVLKEIGCKEGYAWVQAMYDEDGHFYILEMGYRLDGDLMFIPYKDMLNYDVVKNMVDIALGDESDINKLPPSQTKAFTRCGIGMEMWTNKTGICTEIKGIDEMAAIPGIYARSLVHVGDELTIYKNIANVAFTSDTIDDACKMIDKINRTVQILNEKGEDVTIKYTDFGYLKKIYYDGLERK